MFLILCFIYEPGGIPSHEVGLEVLKEGAIVSEIVVHEKSHYSIGEYI
jgi:hypothetical protein